MRVVGGGKTKGGTVDGAWPRRASPPRAGVEQVAAVVLVAAGKECMEGRAVVAALEVVVGGKVGAAGSVESKLRAPRGLAAACGNVGAACHGGDSDVVGDGGGGAKLVTVHHEREAEAMVGPHEREKKKRKRGSLGAGRESTVLLSPTNICLWRKEMGNRGTRTRAIGKPATSNVREVEDEKSCFVCNCFVKEGCVVGIGVLLWGKEVGYEL